MHRHLLIALGAVLFLATPALASVDEIQLQVKGLACPFCVYGFERSIKQVPGVESIETTIRTGLVEVHVKPDALLVPAQFEDALRKSGFTLDHISATVTGKLVTRNDHPGLEASDSGQVFLLLEKGGEEGTFEPLTEETLEKLKQASQDGSRPLTVSGRVHGHAATSPALTVDIFNVSE